MAHAWLNGALVPEESASFALADHGALLGDGLFETFLARRGRVRDLRAHLARLRTSCDRMGLQLPDDDRTLTAAIGAVTRDHQSDVVRVRITVTSGPGPAGLRRGPDPARVAITAAPYTPLERDITTVTLPWPRNEHSPIAGLKTISMAENVLAARHAHPADEGIWLNSGGELCEGTTTNVFLDLGKGLVTPPLSSGCLPGVARGGVLARAVHWGIPVGEHSLEGDILDDVRAGRVGMFVTSAVRGIAVVASLDGHDVVPGVLTARLKELFEHDDDHESVWEIL